MSTYFEQEPYDLRCEWGPEGVRRLAPTSDAVIIVDIFSFTTAVDAAVSRGAKVYPFRWKDERAEVFAREKGAQLAVSSRKDPQGLSLSPRSLLKLEPGSSIVLPSPNGATLSLATGGMPTFAGCLRNASAVAKAAASLGPRIAVIPAGERWEDGSLRPGLEDLLGAGAILYALPGKRSPEAELAAAAFLHFSERLPEILADCSSGREAGDRGSAEDVQLAAEWNISPAAPRLIDEAYQNAAG